MTTKVITVPAEVNEAADRAFELILSRAPGLKLDKPERDRLFWTMYGIGMRDGVDAIMQYAKTVKIQGQEQEAKETAVSQEKTAETKPAATSDNGLRFYEFFFTEGAYEPDKGMTDDENDRLRFEQSYSVVIKAYQQHFYPYAEVWRFCKKNVTGFAQFKDPRIWGDVLRGFKAPDYNPRLINYDAAGNYPALMSNPLHKKTEPEKSPFFDGLTCGELRHKASPFYVSRHMNRRLVSMPEFLADDVILRPTDGKQVLVSPDGIVTEPVTHYVSATYFPGSVYEQNVLRVCAGSAEIREAPFLAPKRAEGGLGNLMHTLNSTANFPVEDTWPVIATMSDGTTFTIKSVEITEGGFVLCGKGETNNAQNEN